MAARAKARLRRMVVAIPVAGAISVVAFEEMDFREWQEENPNGTRGEYACEMYVATLGVVDEFFESVEPVLAKIPELLRPSRDSMIGDLPECTSPN